MKKNLFFLFALAVGALAALSSCNNDPCKNVECGANGSCFEGDCVCNVGYEGTNCEFTFAAKFVGQYGGKDECVSTDPDLAGTFIIKDTEPVKISEVKADEIRIDNIGGWQNTFTTKITKKTSDAATGTEIQFEFTDSAGRKFKGDGTYNATSKTLSGKYRVTLPASAGGTFADCTYTYTKK